MKYKAYRVSNTNSLKVDKVCNSPNDFELIERKYLKHSLFDQTDMHAYIDISRAIAYLRMEFGDDLDIVGDESKYFEFFLAVQPNLSSELRTEKFWIDFTPLNLGGWHYWLKCLECKSRKTKLYVTQNRVACMDCLGLIYVTKRGTASSARVRLYKHIKSMDLLRSGRQMTYAGKPTRFGRQFNRYYDDLKGLQIR